MRNSDTESTPADIDPNWLRSRAGRIRGDQPANGRHVEGAPQDDFEEEFEEEFDQEHR